MRRKQVWRYYCDFCKKSNCSVSAMSVHEKHCTMNPDRICRLCLRVDEVQKPMKELLALLPDPNSFQSDTNEFPFYDEELLQKAIEAVMPTLREATNNCPNCILAALRQKGIPVLMATSFSYKNEMTAFWLDINSQEYEADQRASLYL